MFLFQSRTSNKTLEKDSHLFVLENVTLDDAGWYTCVAVNSIGRTETYAYIDVVTGM